MLNNNELYTHNLFPYPAKFPAIAVRGLMLEYSSEGDTILDPFCGSGTVLVESLLNGRNGIGIELNPVAVLVSRAKTNIYTEQDLSTLAIVIELLNEIQINRDDWISRIIGPKDIPIYKNRDLWFKKNMLYELTALRKNFLNSNIYERQVNDLLWMAFLKIIVPVSNQDTDTRYSSIEKDNLIDGYAIQLFRDTLENYHSALENSLYLVNDKKGNIQIIEGDVNRSIVKLPDNLIDIIITSPPYINTFDYYLYHKQRIFWLGKNPQEIRRQEIGCHHRVDTMSYQRALYEYSFAMDKLFKSSYKKLKNNKYFIMLIGDGIVKGNIVKGDSLIKEIAESNGFSIENINTIGLKEVSRGFIKGRNLERKKHHVIVMRKC